MTPTPWAEPELIARGRLPMHAVPHADRLPLDGTWRFQLLHAPRRGARRHLAVDRGPGRLDDAGHLGPAHLHQYPDAVPAAAAGGPSREPDRHLRANVPPPGRVGRSPGRPARRGGRERADRGARWRGGWRLQGFAPRRRVRPHGPPWRRRRAHAAADRGQVVRRNVHRGPGPVVARRDHTLRVPLRHGTRVPRRRGDRCGARRRRLHRHPGPGGPRRLAARPAGSGLARRGLDREPGLVAGRRGAPRTVAAGRAGRLDRPRAAPAGHP